MEEEIETPLEQPETELPAPSFWEKLKTNKGKILGGILGILIFAGAVFGAYELSQRQIQPGPTATPTPAVIATPTPDPTADWEIYTNTEVGFSFKYPRTLAPSECKDGLHLFEATNELEVSEFCETPPFGKISLDYATTPFSPGYSQSLDFETKEEQITVGGVEATKQTVKKIKEAPGPDYAVFVIFSKDSYHFLISLGEKQYELTFNLVLSTFRFLEEGTTSPTPIPASKTYQDQEIGYGITYPSDWVFKKTYGKDIPKVGQTDVVNGIEIYKPNQPFTFVLNVIDTKGTTSVVDWWNQYSPNRLSPDEKIDRPNFSFKENDAVKRSKTPGGSPPSRVIDEIHFLWRDYIYFLSLSYSPNELSKELLDIAYSLELP